MAHHLNEWDEKQIVEKNRKNVGLNTFKRMYASENDPQMIVVFFQTFLREKRKRIYLNIYI